MTTACIAAGHRDFMDLENALERSGVLDDPPRCGAKSKRTQNPCKNRPVPGGSRCKWHGGTLSRRPAAHTTKHGQTTRYIDVAKLPEILARIEELRTTKGKEHALLTGAAVVEHRLQKLPDDPEFIDKLVQARKSIREDLKVSHELTDDKPQAPTTFVLNNFDPTQHAPFQGRTIDGPCQIRYLEGEPFMLQDRCWVPCAELTDEESGAKYFTRVLDQ